MAIITNERHGLSEEQWQSNSPELTRARAIISSTLDSLNDDLRNLNQAIHSHPEICYEEVYAHDTITAFLEAHGFTVTRHAYGLATSFSAEAGSGGRLVVFCAEYDALPGIGHGCGHNLIATASVAAFAGAAKALLDLGVAGRVRLLGTPAEEGGGGKAKLIKAGAFPAAQAGGDENEGVWAAIMSHALPLGQIKEGWSGTAGFRSTALQRLKVEFHGRNAHAGQEPWNGVNALDAAVGAYTTISMLRQQIRPEERVQGVIEDGGRVPNIIPDYTRMAWAVRSPDVSGVDALFERVKNCCRASALASGCTVDFTEQPPYMELRVNAALCNAYIEEMKGLGRDILFMDDKPSAAGTDMGNVSHVVPSFHGIFGIPTEPGVAVHSRNFASAASTEEGHRAALESAKGMAMLGLRVLAEPGLAERARDNFHG
ncbi:hypothetical protein J7T55_005853 [Diaporthe amygdali]|uniref:uncharacterized protein n=1 Tax=Phomopsis amygdali TaxID=1214568 RepID=UPI0022FE26F9|nr:uncharacterized protein J7T55_005853 [Diaporthe amygdali]KAJ0124515.1 hypothetical protein J7T55_005853 [Diaporthe amygdali]